MDQAMRSDGLDVAIVDARDGIIPDHDILVILGGPQSANDPLEYLRAQERTIRQDIARQTPVLGVCLGSQLVARALGARVYRGHRAEVGFYDVRPADRAGIFEGLRDPFSAFHWHNDTFDLPRGAKRLAGSYEYPNQAFEVGSAIGVQFHLEAGADQIRLWLDSGMTEGDRSRILDEIDRMSAAVMSNFDIFYRNLRPRLGLTGGGAIQIS